MAIYHFEAKVISRGKGQSAIASASYRSGEKLYSERYNKFSFYGRSVARQSDEVKKAFQGIIQPLARYEMAIKAVHYYHETTIKEHLPMIDSKQLNGLQKEQLCNAILYFGDLLEEMYCVESKW